MKITKYEHACIVIEEKGDRLVIDPGNFTELPSEYRASGLVVTHIHDDHITKDNFNNLVTTNPDLMFFTTSEVSQKFANATAVAIGAAYNCGQFVLQFFGGKHEQVHPDYPAAENVGVLINGKIYYPGDSFAKPNDQVEVLLVPAAAPWMKTSQAMDFITEIKPRIVIPTHYGVLSDEGSNYTNNWLKLASEKAGAEYKRLSSGDSIEF